MKRLVVTAALLVAAAAGVVWAHARTGPRLHVDYYYIPHCLACARVLRSLDGFGGQFGSRVEVRTIDCFSPEGVAAAGKYGFVTHGIVVEDADRQLLFEEKDHGVSADDVRVIVREELARR
jgi:hypothetical protein